MKSTYEIGYVLNPEASDEDVKKVSDAILGIIKKGKGDVESVDEWGRKPLAYPIQKHQEGIFTFINTDVDGSVISSIERRLKLSEKVMRFIVLRLDDKLKKANKLTKRWKKAERHVKKSREPQASQKRTREEIPAVESEVKDEE
jgi:small subunit ribosomal protein S6